MTDADLSPDPKSKPAPVAGSHISEATRTYETVSYETGCPACGTRQRADDRATAVAMAVECCSG